MASGDIRDLVQYIKTGLEGLNISVDELKDKVERSVKEQTPPSQEAAVADFRNRLVEKYEISLRRCYKDNNEKEQNSIYLICKNMDGLKEAHISEITTQYNIMFKNSSEHAQDRETRSITFVQNPADVEDIFLSRMKIFFDLTGTTCHHGHKWPLLFTLKNRENQPTYENYDKNSCRILNDLDPDKDNLFELMYENYNSEYVKLAKLINFYIDGGTVIEADKIKGKINGHPEYTDNLENKNKNNVYLYTTDEYAKCLIFKFGKTDNLKNRLNTYHSQSSPLEYHSRRYYTKVFQFEENLPKDIFLYYKPMNIMEDRLKNLLKEFRISKQKLTEYTRIDYKILEEISVLVYENLCKELKLAFAILQKVGIDSRA